MSQLVSQPPSSCESLLYHCYLHGACFTAFSASFTMGILLLPIYESVHSGRFIYWPVLVTISTLVSFVHLLAINCYRSYRPIDTINPTGCQLWQLMMSHSFCHCLPIGGSCCSFSRAPCGTHRH